MKLNLKSPCNAIRKSSKASIDFLKRKLNTRKKKIVAGLVAVMVLGLGSYGMYNAFSTEMSTATAVTDMVKKGSVTKSIDATGTVSYPDALKLGFEQSGNGSLQLTELNVKPGDKVTQGQVLAKIDDTTLEQTLSQKELNLASTEAKFQEALESSNSTVLSTLSSAMTKLNSAQEALNTAKREADPAYLTNQVFLAKQKIAAASLALTKAEQSGVSTNVPSAQSSLNEAENSLITVQNAQNGGAQKTLEIAESDYDAAKSNFEAAEAQAKRYSSSYSPTLLSAQASLAQAQADLSEAQDNYANASIVAPIDGVIVAVSAKNYETVSSSDSIITMVAATDIFEIQTTVDQSDITKVAVGQKATITLDTLSDTEISATVSQVDLQGTTTSGVTTFSVVITIDEPSAVLRAGMNANVSIILAQSKDVLTIPSEAVVKRDNSYFVRVPKNAGSSNITQADVTMVQVEIGLDDDTNVEIKSGLTEGQTIVTSFKNAASSTSSSSGSNSGSSSANNSQRSNGNVMGGMTGGGGMSGGPPPGN